MRDYGETFTPDQIGWLDFESRSKTPIDVGTHRYAREASAIVFAYAIGDGPAATVTYFRSGAAAPLRWERMPDRLHKHHERVQRGEAVWAAWNAGFDRAIWNHATVNFPKLLPEQIIDVMAQAMAAGLPGDLAGAAMRSGAVRKLATGKKLIKLFCEGDATPLSHPVEWQEFLAYAAGDIEAMRGVFRRTLQLPIEDWREYWAAERINDRGIGCDLNLAVAAAAIAKVDKVRMNADLATLTGGAVTKVTQVQRLIGWLGGVLDPEGRAIMVRKLEETDEETGEVVAEAKTSLNRHRLQLLVAQLHAKKKLSRAEKCALRALLIRQYGGSTTPAKFSRMLEQHVGGVLSGQYVFNGAAQTGRFSSRGVQIHNLMRDALPYEMDAIDALLAGCDYAAFERLGDSTPVSRKLSMLIRPTLVPQDEAVFVWGDWSQIEARITPWLANTREAAKRLDIFREVDADPSLPDLYTRTASAMSGVPVHEVTKPMRQRGKVSELALTFCGGRRALQSMAANYGLHFSDAEADELVEQWRIANPWAIDYSREIWEAVRETMTAPGRQVPAGLVTYVYHPGYLGGSLLCQLPSGRVLTYRSIRWERVDVLDDDGVVTDTKLELMFARGHGRMKLWPGLFVENITQATAADVLRGTLVRLLTRGHDVRAHTHDEVLLETYPELAHEMGAKLRAAMEEGFSWSKGLPLKADVTAGYAYSKCEAAEGL